MDQTEIQTKQLQFESLLERTKDSILDALSKISDPARLLNGESFESLVAKHIINNAIGTDFENKLTQTQDREFPDIVDHEYFGVEVKVTKKDNWTSIGNSVLESSRNNAAKKIYVFFGKLGGTPDIMIRNYEDVLKGIAVTHYPRYQIDMNIKKENSIFFKMKTTYNEISTSHNPVKKIRDYYKSISRPGDALWWIDDDNDALAITSGPIVRKFSQLNKSEKEDILSSLYIKFPGILGSNIKKYEQVATYLVTRHGVVSSNVRDIFSAGGVGRVSYNNETMVLPKIAINTLDLAILIKRRFDSLSRAELADIDQTDIQEARSSWLRSIDVHSAHMGLAIKLSALFDARISGHLKIM